MPNRTPSSATPTSARRIRCIRCSSRALLEMALLPSSTPLLMGCRAAMATRCCCCPASWPTRNRWSRQALPPAQGLRRANLGPGPQPRLPQQACQRAAAEDPLPAPCDRDAEPVGWSLGGVFRPHGAENTLGVRALHHHAGQPGQRRCLAAASRRRRQGAVPAGLAPPRPAAHVMQPRAKTLREQRRLAIPTSCLYSLSDGVVPPQEATIDGDPTLHREHPRSRQPHRASASTASCCHRRRPLACSPEGAWRPFRPRACSSASGASPSAHRVLRTFRRPPDMRQPAQRTRRRLHLLRQRARQLQRHAAAHLRPVDRPRRPCPLQTDPGPGESRLGQLPMFREKILRVLLDLDFPYWIEDENFDIRVPRAPHRAAQAGRLAPVLHPGGAHPRRPLDLNRPLWKST